MGKTGSLVSLVKAGYKLRIADMDNGLDILKNLLRSEPNASELLQRVNYQTLTDPMRVAGVQIIPSKAEAWSKLVGILQNWPEGQGKISEWGPDTVFVLDTLNFAGKAAVRFVQSLNARLGQQPNWGEYYSAQQMLESLCAMLYSDQIKCNVIVLSHVREVSKKEDRISPDGRVQKVEIEGSRRGYAETGAGTALSPNMGRYFNGVLMMDQIGSGPSARKIIRTVSFENIGLKNPSPNLVRPEYPIATGLADYFRAVRGSLPVATKPAVLAGLPAQ